MKDRIPTPGKEGRVLITPQNGAAPYYATITMADDALEEGTGLVKANLLTDETASRFGLNANADAVPNDVLSWLGARNLHWWSRRPVTWKSVLTTGRNPYFITSESSAAQARAISYASDIEIDSAGVVHLKEPVLIAFVSYTEYSSANALKGMYLKGAYQSDGTYIDGVFWIPADADDAAKSGSYNVKISMKDVASVPIAEAAEDLVFSANPSEYPSGIQNGQLWKHLGIPFDNAAHAAGVEIVEYIGTGANGASHKNSLTFARVPSVVLITPKADAGARVFLTATLCVLFPQHGVGISVDPDSALTSVGLTVNLDQTTVSWYSDNSDGLQMNAADTKYIAAAFG